MHVWLGGLLILGKEMCGQARTQPSSLVVPLFSLWSFDSQGMNHQSLYPGLGGPSASCLKKTGVDAHLFADLKATLLEKRTLLHFWWECKLVQPLWKAICSFLKKTQNWVAILTSNPTLRPRSRQNHNSKRYIHFYVWWLNCKESACNAGDTELRVWSLGREDPLEVEMATHSSILDWKKSHGQRSLVGYSL